MKNSKKGGGSLLLGQLAYVSQGITLSRIQPTNPTMSERFSLFTMKEMNESLGFQISSREEEQFAEVDKQKQNQIVLTAENMVLINLIARKAVVVTNQHVGKVIPSNFAIVEVDTTKLNPYYFAWYFNEHPICQRQLRIATQGSIVSALSIQMLRKLKVILPTREQQQRIGRMYQLQIRKKLLMTQRQQLEEMIIKQIMLNAIQED